MASSCAHDHFLQEANTISHVHFLMSRAWRHLDVTHVPLVNPGSVLNKTMSRMWIQLLCACVRYPMGSREHLCPNMGICDVIGVTWSKCSILIGRQNFCCALIGYYSKGPYPLLISCTIHWFTFSSSERATPNSRKLRAKCLPGLLPCRKRNFTTRQASCSRNTRRRWRSSVCKF